MRKRFLAILLALTLTVAMVPEAFAVDSGSITDISGHWAEDAIRWALEGDVFKGVSETSFQPNTPMTRGMFVTVLGRMAGVAPEDYSDTYALFQDVPANSYYAPYITWAVRYGIAKGTGDGVFSPNAPVTREQMATFVVRYASIYNYEMVSLGENVVDSFADADKISNFAAESVEAMRQTGILNGRSQGDGTYRFDPKNSTTRAECAVVLQRLDTSLQPFDGRETVDPTEIWITGDTDTLTIGQWTYLEAGIAPEDASNQTITWASSDPGVATVNLSGMVTAVGEGTAEIYAYTWNGFVDSYTITCKRNVSLSYDGETYAEKCIRVFGTEVPDPRRYYQSADEAYSHMVTITVPVWDYADSTHTTKVTKYKYLTVHENMADSIQTIFEEIYNGDEQFPIKDVGCYRWEYGSEHMPGLAIDINPNENCEIRGGVITTGSYWKPGEDPYSIPADGDVVNAFKKYGFGWGGNWRSVKDYMHFSYFST